MKKIFTILSLFVANLSTTATATDILVTESDTGIVFSGNQCAIQSNEIQQVTFDYDFFLGLYVEVVVQFGCLGPNGALYYMIKSDSMFFPEATFDVSQQAWVANRRQIATLANSTVVPSEDLSLDIWRDQQQNHVSVKVQFWEETEEGDDDDDNS